MPHQTAALPIVYVTLRILVVLNIISAVCILTLLLVMPHTEWIMRSLNLAPGAEANRIIWGLRSVAVLGLLAAPLNHGVLKRLLAMVGTVRAGDPFVADNAFRLNQIAWLLLLLQGIGMVIGAIARFISTPENPFDFGGFSIAGWLAVLLTFVLARIFAEGTLMRRDLDGVI